jgi:hypothetical protein
MPGRTSENSACRTEGVDRATVWAALQREQQVVTEPEVQSKSNPQAATELEVVAEKETDGNIVDIDKEIHELDKMLKEDGPQTVVFWEQLVEVDQEKLEDKDLRRSQERRQSCKGEKNTQGHRQNDFIRQ